MWETQNEIGYTVYYFFDICKRRIKENLICLLGIRNNFHPFLVHNSQTKAARLNQAEN